jgi:pre-mRNA-splicing factor ISY1
LLRELYHWEIRIKELGGNDYRAIKNAKMYDAQGREIPGFGGYRYFGAAKDLPGVRDIYKREIPIAPAKSAAQIRRSIDQEYFGDQEALDQELLREEKLEEETRRSGELAEWMENNKKKIEQFFRGRDDYTFEELVSNIDSIEEFEVQLEEHMGQAQTVEKTERAPE